MVKAEVLETEGPWFNSLYLIFFLLYSLFFFPFSFSFTPFLFLSFFLSSIFFPFLLFFLFLFSTLFPLLFFLLFSLLHFSSCPFFFITYFSFLILYIPFILFHCFFFFLPFSFHFYSIIFSNEATSLLRKKRNFNLLYNKIKKSMKTIAQWLKKIIALWKLAIMGLNLSVNSFVSFFPFLFLLFFLLFFQIFTPHPSYFLLSFLLSPVADMKVIFTGRIIYIASFRDIN